VAWIEVHQSLPRHRKTLTLAEELGVSPIQCVGHLVAFWLWSVDNADDDGVICGSDRVIASAAEWPGEPDQFVAALYRAGLLERGENGPMIHDWPDYIGKLNEARRKNAEKQKRWRENNRHVTYIKEERNGDVTVTYPSRNPATVPNPTVPDQTQTLVTNVTSAAPNVAAPNGHLPKKKREVKPTPSTEMWDACIAAGFPAPVTANERGRLNAWIAQLVEADVKPDEIKGMRSAFESLFPGVTVTVGGICNHVAELRQPSKVAPAKQNGHAETPSVYDSPLYTETSSRLEAERKRGLTLVTDENTTRVDRRADLAALKEALGKRSTAAREPAGRAPNGRPTFHLNGASNG
jgi:hypothetical protein